MPEVYNTCKDHVKDYGLQYSELIESCGVQMPTFNPIYHGIGIIFGLRIGQQALNFLSFLYCIFCTKIS